MGIISTAPRKPRTTKQQKVEESTLLVEPSVNKGTLTFSTDLVDKFNLDKTTVSLFVGEEEDAPEVRGRAFLVFGLDTGRKLEKGIAKNAAFFIENLFTVFNIEDEDDLKVMVHVSDEVTPYDFVIGEEPLSLYEITLKETSLITDNQ